MKSLVISDVHANVAALAALPSADVILCAGDVVTFGPEPGAVIDVLSRVGVRCVRGDEDDAVARGTPHAAPPHLEAAAVETRVWTRSVLTPTQMRWLGELPPEVEFDAGGIRLAATHAYPGDYDRYLRPNGEELQRIARAFPRADVVILGHTHRRGLWRVGATTVLMPGSVGQSSRGGYASFALIEDGAVSLHEVPYDVESTMRQIQATPWSSRVKADCVAALRNGTARPHERVAPRRLSTIPPLGAPG